MPHKRDTFFHRAADKKLTKAKPVGSHAVGIHINPIIQYLLKYKTNLTERQKLIVKASLPRSMTLSRKYDIFDILDAIFHITKTGCQRRMLPSYPPALHVSPASVHDSKGACPLTASPISGWTRISTAKADPGYAGPSSHALSESSSISLECVRSNLGTPELIPIDGRRVVERTSAWLENYRRVCRNYGRLLKVARHMAVTACVCVMLKYFR